MFTLLTATQHASAVPELLFCDPYVLAGQLVPSRFWILSQTLARHFLNTQGNVFNFLRLLL